MRLWWPTAVFVVAGILAAAAARRRAWPRPSSAEAGWLVALQLWFLPVYLLLIALTPALLAAHRRWGLVVPAVMAAATALVDKGVIGAAPARASGTPTTCSYGARSTSGASPGRTAP